MIFFFARNIILVETQNMDSWMGGGMRMFAQIDKMLYRVAGVNIEKDGKTYFLNFRKIPELHRADIEARLLPNDNRLNEILDQIRQMSWCYDKKRDTIIFDKEGCNTPISKREIKSISVYKTDFENTKNLISLKLLNQSNVR